MPVTFVASGTYAAGNNASVVPGLPSGLVAGDLMILCASIRSATGSVNFPSGWSGTGLTMSDPGAVVFGNIYYRYYQVGDTAPTVTFGGGGTGTTTQAQIFALRGAATSFALAYNAATTTDITSAALPDRSTTYADPDYKVGDYLFAFWAQDNDGLLLTATSGMYNKAGTKLTTDILQGGSTSGTDAAQAVFGATATILYNGTTDYLYARANISGTNAGNGVYRTLYVRQSGTSFTGNGTGGARVGGAATVSFTPGLVSYVATGSGGHLAGGAATVTVKNVNSVAVGSGGLRVAGAAGSSVYNVATYLATSAGGLAVGGSAGTVLVARKTYYIDPFLGSDANTGLSWGSAFKTFHPIASRQVPVAAGTAIRVAKTPDAVATGLLFNNMKLWGTKVPNYSSDSIRDTPSGYGLVPADFNKLKVICVGDSSSAWVASGAAGTDTYTVSSTDVSQGQFIHVVSNTDGYYASMAVGQLISHYQTPSTLDLSSFGRLEFEFWCEARDSATSSASPQWSLNLCSDTGGSTPLLSIPLSLTALPNIVGYEGALPSGVNSISFTLAGKEDRMNTNARVRNFIATAPLTSADYRGLYCQFRLGAHAGASWTRVEYYKEITGANYAYFSSMTCGAAAVHNTQMQLYRRVAVSWDAVGRTNTAADPFGNGNNPIITAAELHMDSGALPLFDLTGVVGDATEYVTITGGYDTATNTVTGITALMCANVARNTGLRNFTTPFWFRGSSYVKFANCSFMVGGTGYWLPIGDNHHITYENCEFSRRATAAYSYGNIVGKDSEVTAALHTMEFVDCYGDFMPTHANIQHSSYRATLASRFYNFIMENCTLTAYAGTWTRGLYDSAIPCVGEIVMVGDLTCYCIANFIGYGNNANPARLYAPPIVSGAQGTLRIYGGGGMYFIAATPAGTYGGTYTYPAHIIMENGTVFLTCDNYNFTDGDALRGVPDATVMPDLTLTFTNAAWCTTTDTSTYYSMFNPDSFICMEHIHVPPIDVQKLTVTGARFNVTTLDTAIVATAANSSAPGALVAVSDMTLSTDANWAYRLVEYPTSSVHSHQLVILDTLNLANKAETALTGNQQQVPNVYGHMDFRDIAWALPSSTTYFTYCNTSVFGTARFLRCALQNFSSSNSNFVNFTGISADTLYYGATHDAGVVLEDSPLMTLNATIISTDTVFWATTANSYAQMHGNYSVLDTTTGAYTRYTKGYRISKDYSTFVSGPFSWKSRLTIRHYFTNSYYLPLGDVPLRAGKTVTISLYVRRATTADNFISLVIDHRGAAGFATPTELRELKLISNGAANTWQILTTTFAVQRSETITLSISHTGLHSATAWWDDLRVTEV